MSQIKKNKDEQKQLFADLSVEALREVAQVFGIHEDKIPEDASRDQLLELIKAAKRHDIAVAKTVRTTNGKELDCPPGHMVIKVTPKAPGLEFGNKSREIFFFAINGNPVFGRRGVEVVIPDKYRSCWQDAVRYEYTLDGEPSVGVGGELLPPKLQRVEVMAEDVTVLYWNRDEAAERKAEEELIANSVKYQEERKAARALSTAVLQHFGQ